MGQRPKGDMVSGKEAETDKSFSGLPHYLEGCRRSPSTFVADLFYCSRRALGCVPITDVSDIPLTGLHAPRTSWCGKIILPIAQKGHASPQRKISRVLGRTPGPRGSTTSWLPLRDHAIPAGVEVDAGAPCPAQCAEQLLYHRLKSVRNNPSVSRQCHQLNSQMPRKPAATVPQSQDIVHGLRNCQQS